MRFFLCSFKDFLLAIPIQAVSSLVLYSGEAAAAMTYNEENGNTYFSLPHLFNLPKETIRHGIVLKDPESEEDWQDDAAKNRNILLTTEVEREIDISDIDIYPLPRFFSGLKFSAVFRGVQFIETEGNSVLMVLVLKSGYLAGLARDNSHRTSGGAV